MAGQTQMSAQLVVSGLKKHFRGRTILSELSLAVASREIVSLLGPSGIGKTTLLNMIVGCEMPDEGAIERGSTRIGYVFQEDRLMPWLTLWENIRLVAPKAPKSLIDEALKVVALSDFKDFYPRELSGGMRQRGAIARALCFGADLLLLDEPFKSLDLKLRYELLDLLKRLRDEQGISSLLVTHDLDEALYVADRLLVLNGAPACVCAEHQLTVPSAETEQTEETNHTEETERTRASSRVDKARLHAIREAVWDLLHAESPQTTAQRLAAQEAVRMPAAKPIRRGGNGCGCSSGLLSGPKPKRHLQEEYFES